MRLTLLSTLLMSLLLLACRTSASSADISIPEAPNTIPVTSDDGSRLAEQPGPLWILISGVDEHGLIAEPNVYLLSEPGVASFSGEHVHTGEPAIVHEIRHTGPQRLRSYYRIESVHGFSGWVSDYNIRRVVYLFDSSGERVGLYDNPDGNRVIDVPNVSPVSLKDPTADGRWWRVATQDGTATGWVPAEMIKESPEPEFLINGGLSADHDH